MTIEIKGNLPKRQHEYDAGADLVAAEDWEIGPGSRALVPTGTHLNLPEGTVGYITPRSGLASKHGITVLNAPGTIDSGYTGEIKVLLINHGDETFFVNEGDRIAQLVVQPVNQTKSQAVPEPTARYGARGDNGAGSTG